MFNESNIPFEDDINFEKFNFSALPFESFERQKNLFPSMPADNIPPGLNQPNFNYPGGTFNPPGIPKSPPPNYIPKKNAPEVQKLGAYPGESGISTKAVSSGSIRFCLYKYTYIWEVSGRNYWAFLLNVDRRSASGFRWFRNTWVYWGIDLRRIDSFICYRADDINDNCPTCDNLTRDKKSQININKDFSLNEIREIYSNTLSSIDIPEFKEEIINKVVGCIDDTILKNDLPCVKTRDIGYRLTLEVSYPYNFDNTIKNTIKNFVDEASDSATKIISANRSDISSDPLEAYNVSLALVPEALKAFSESFNKKLSSLAISESNAITYSIRSEKIYTNWKPLINTNPF
ncbi:hypothetical protein [Clostridium saccharoperbutylacetonicum]